MDAIENSMLLVKPDGVAKGLEGEIRSLILAEGLMIKREIDRILLPETVRKIYSLEGDLAQRDYFPQVVEFMSSSPIYTFIVSGERAVSRVRTIIGKREPASGIRARWAESIVKNIAHGPHSPKLARREIELVLDNGNLQRVFLLGGMSESGKSTLGRYLDSRGIPRLKIVSFLKTVMQRECPTAEFYEWNNKNVAERPEWVREVFTEEFLFWTHTNNIRNCCLESLYGPELGVYMREHLEGRAVVVYVDMPLEVRLQRQVIRENLFSLEEAKKILLPRDEVKKRWKVPEIEKVADVVIDNTGSLGELHQKADEMISRYLNH